MSDGAAGSSGDAGDAGDASQVWFDDFPMAPVVVPGTPGDAPALFSGAGPGGSGPGPCLSEPPIGAMYPSNWTPPLFEWNAPPGMNLFEIRLHVDNQIRDLLVYTDQTSYSLPASLWASLAAHSAGHAISLSLRGATLANGRLTSGPAIGATGDVSIAPVPAPGSIVYWTTSGGSALKGFEVGQASPTTLVVPSQMNLGNGCVGCHTASPDGQFLFIDWQTASPVSHSLAMRSVGSSGVQPPPPGVVSAYAASLLARIDQTAPVLSPAHFSASDAIALSVLTDASTNRRSEIVWTDLHATAGGTGVVLRQGDARQATTPSWSEDGATIVYGSTDDEQVGVPGRGPAGVSPEADIYVVPFAGGSGGSATPLAGASEPGVSEYYPVYSPRGSLVAFARSTANLKRSDPAAEVYVVGARGGASVRVAGNDPPTCTGLVSPGVTNSWPRWAPTALASGGKRYYWLVFSSTRRSPSPQLFISAVVTREQASAEIIDATYPAVYVTSQVAGEGNHTPAWTTLRIQ